MTLKPFLQRWWHTLRNTVAAPRSVATPIDFTGIDFTSPARVHKSKQHPKALMFVAIFGAALTLLALRVEIIRLRYELASSVQYEQELLAAKREQTVAVRKLRDPARLRRLAEQHGMAYPEQIIRAPRPSASPQESAQ